MRDEKIDRESDLANALSAPDRRGLFRKEGVSEGFYLKNCCSND
jgi:hypothetical protein